MSLESEYGWIFSEDNGMWLFGVCLDLLLFGVLVVQTYVYYLAFPTDSRLLKLAVAWVFLVGAAQTILAVLDLNDTFDHNRYKYDGPDGTQNHFWLTAVVFSTAVAMAAQWLYAYRIYIISRKLWIVVLVVCLSLAQLGTSILGSFCLWGSYVGELFIFGGSFGICAVGFGWIWGPLNFLCDVTITVSMSILLVKRRRGVLKKTTHDHITSIIRLMVETGLITSIVVVVYAVTYNLANQGLPGAIWTIPGLAMGKVYSNSMLALLNSRLTIVGSRNTGAPFLTSDIRSEVLRTEFGEDQTTSAATRRRTPNGESSGTA